MWHYQGEKKNTFIPGRWGVYGIFLGFYHIIFYIVTIINCDEQFSQINRQRKSLLVAFLLAYQLRLEKTKIISQCFQEFGEDVTSAAEISVTETPRLPLMTRPF